MNRIHKQISIYIIYIRQSSPWIVRFLRGEAETRAEKSERVTERIIRDICQKRKRKEEKRKRKIGAANFEWWNERTNRRLSSGCQRSRNFTSWTRRGLLSRLLESRKRRQSHGRLARIWISARFLLESAISQVSRVSRASHGFFGFIGSNPFLISEASPLRATRDRCSAWFESRRRLVLGKNVVKARHGFLPWNDTTEYRWKLESFEKTRRFSKEPSPNRVTNPSKIIYSSCVSSLYTFYT